MPNDVTDMETDERPRRIAGRYVVDRMIARGGMAVVYLAQHADLRRNVALKILRPPEEDDNPVDFEDRFRLEAQTLAGLDHPNIVTLHDFGELDDGRCFLAMEFVDGPRLSDLVKQGPLPAEHAIRLMMQVCSALRYAHKRGVIHRDLKPSNLLIRTHDDGSEQVKVVDFGLVKLTDAEQSMTRAGLVLGSPHCMSPEQVRGQDVSPATDVYAIGVLLFRTILGQYPFHGSNPAATMMAHLNGSVPTFFGTAPDVQVPEGLEEIVRRCLEKDPAKRYPSMTELMADLASTVDLPSGVWGTASFGTAATSMPRTVPTLAVPTPEPERNMLPWILAAVLLGFLGLGLGLGAVQALREAPADEVIAKAEPRQAPPEPAPVEPVATPEPAAEAPEPAPAEPVATPEPVEAVATPTPRPRATPKPRAVGTPKPVVPAATPAPAPTPAPTPVPTPEATTPDGYKGLPDDW